MSDITLDTVLDTVMELPLEQQEMLLDIVRKRHIERRRQEIARDAQESLAAFRAGQLRPQSAFATQLGTHKLSGELYGLWACSCGYDCRIVFTIEVDQETDNEVIVLLDVGTHDEVY